MQGFTRAFYSDLEKCKSTKCPCKNIKKPQVGHFNSSTNSSVKSERWSRIFVKNDHASATSLVITYFSQSTFSHVSYDRACPPRSKKKEKKELRIPKKKRRNENFHTAKNWNETEGMAGGSRAETGSTRIFFRSLLADNRGSDRCTLPLTARCTDFHGLRAVTRVNVNDSRYWHIACRPWRFHLRNTHGGGEGTSWRVLFCFAFASRSRQLRERLSFRELNKTSPLFFVVRWLAGFSSSRSSLIIAIIIGP